MTKRQYDEYSQRRELEAAGWRVQQRDSIAFNSGAESQNHYQTKAAAAWVLHQNNYRVDSEVEITDNQQTIGEVDLLGYGRGDGDIIVVECEQNPTQEIIKDKLEKYYHNQPPREVFVLSVEDCPSDFSESITWVQDEIGSI